MFDHALFSLGNSVTCGSPVCPLDTNLDEFKKVKTLHKLLASVLPESAVLTGRTPWVFLFVCKDIFLLFEISFTMAHSRADFLSMFLIYFSYFEGFFIYSVLPKRQI